MSALLQAFAAIPYYFCNAFYSFKATESQTIKSYSLQFLHMYCICRIVFQAAQTRGFRLSMIAIPYILCNAFYSFTATESRTIKKLFPTFFAVDIQVIHIQYIRSRII